MYVFKFAKNDWYITGAVPEVFSEFDDYLSNLNWPLRTHEDLLFPTLTEEQRKFAVNPSYPEFLAPIVGDLTASNSKFISHIHKMTQKCK